jgi:uncharacterized repeat protein (TIGR03803 family)
LKMTSAVIVLCAATAIMARAQTFANLVDFDGDNGDEPLMSLIQGADGNLYGTTFAGGHYYTCRPGCGTVFKVSLGGITIIHNFCADPTCPDGDQPYAGLILGIDGSFYGSTQGGWVNNDDTVFKITPAGTLTTLHIFGGPDGYGPEAALVQAVNTNFYGTTTGGGNLSCNPPYGCGTVFKITPAGTLTTLHSFDGTDGANPFAGLIQASDDSFYGTTTLGGDGRNGTIFKITLGGELRTLHSFDGKDGSDSQGALVQSTNGTFYGATALGGVYAHGNVFSLDMSLGPFVALVRNSGKIGQTGGILGQGFTGTTSVSLNGIPASFTVVSDTFIKATVPPGATTGFVTVVTPTGMLTSNVPFRVLQ